MTKFQASCVGLLLSGAVFIGGAAWSDTSSTQEREEIVRTLRDYEDSLASLACRYERQTRDSDTGDISSFEEVFLIFDREGGVYVDHKFYMANPAQGGVLEMHAEWAYDAREDLVYELRHAVPGKRSRPGGGISHGLGGVAARYGVTNVKPFEYTLLNTVLHPAITEHRGYVVERHTGYATYFSELIATQHSQRVYADGVVRFVNSATLPPVGQPKQTREHTVTVELDPGRDWMVQSVESVLLLGEEIQLRELIQVKEWQEIAEGVWFPRVGEVFTQTNRGASFIVVDTMLEVTANEIYPAEQFRMTFDFPYYDERVAAVVHPDGAE